MITYVDVVTGFLESGKTTFIQNFLESKLFEEYTRVVLVVCEEGIAEYENMEKYPVELVKIENQTEITDQFFTKLRNDYKPEYILMEYNGAWDISKLLRIKMPFAYKFRNIISISEATKFRTHLFNMPTLVQPHLINSDVVVLNRSQDLDEAERRHLVQDIKNINRRTKAFFLDNPVHNRQLESYLVPFERHDRMITELKITLFVLICFSMIPVFAVSGLRSDLQSISTVFLSILMQAVPFILLGAFISASIQMFVSTGWIIKQFSRGKWLSFLAAALGGLFVPVCDCGMVPIVSGLLKKETPLPQTITFWLASSAVNPIVFFTMLYAFPGQPKLAVIRVAAGMGIGIVTGVVLKILNFQTDEVIRTNSRYLSVGKDILDVTYSGKLGKLEAVVKGAKIEFFRVGEYVIMGAMVSSILQTVVPQFLKNFIGGSVLIQFLVMMIAAVFMSTCSTSNAFIGKSFSFNFATIPILSFIVMGPMLDFKNLIMLSEILKRRFILLLAGLVIIVSSIVFGVIGIFY
ncbi:permease [Anaeromicropila populeti]|uniref:CobW/HypB/UreG nucleotide-binding domain-containing protein n=1 Tax=Anaeromicropila populeti TaxID=37658 RepID=A0A1I6LQ09_9FIRM|nr:permease [Anaeromicropila populeti]SFS05370.1 hypothetical protein SAMN05661086_03474 [Anaeromicropila populeti]